MFRNKFVLVLPIFIFLNHTTESYVSFQFSSADYLGHLNADASIHNKISNEVPLKLNQHFKLRRVILERKLYSFSTVNCVPWTLKTRWTTEQRSVKEQVLWDLLETLNRSTQKTFFVFWLYLKNYRNCIVMKFLWKVV